jgi:hypothetical protein
MQLLGTACEFSRVLNPGGTGSPELIQPTPTSTTPDTIEAGAWQAVRTR